MEYIPYERNPLFTGRQSLLAELDTTFSSPQLDLKIVELIGMPGVGKTEIALEYVYHARQRYEAVIWLPASSYDEFAESISRLLRTSSGTQFPWKTTEEKAHIFAFFRQWLFQYQSRFLLVLDDCQSYYLLNLVLSKESIGHVLITHDSMNMTNDQLESLLVTPFDEQEGSLFLLRRAGLVALSESFLSAPRSVRRAAAAIQKEFGGHPLALDQAGAYVNEMGIRLEEYLPLYREHRSTLLRRRGTTSASRYPFSAYDAITLMRQGSAQYAQKLLMLYVSGQLDFSDPLPRLPPALLRTVASDSSELVKMRHALLNNFLIIPLGRNYEMHPLVMVVMRDILADEVAQEQRHLEEATVYEPLDEEEIYQVLVTIQQLQHHQGAKLQAEGRELRATIIRHCQRLEHGVLPGPRSERDLAKEQIELRYGDFFYGGDDTNLTQASEDILRHYAHDLLAIMHYHRGDEEDV